MSQGKLQDIHFNWTSVDSVFTSCICAAFFCGRAVITGGKRGMFSLVGLPRYWWKNGKTVETLPCTRTRSPLICGARKVKKTSDLKQEQTEGYSLDGKCTGVCWKSAPLSTCFLIPPGCEGGFKTDKALY